MVITVFLVAVWVALAAPLAVIIARVVTRGSRIGVPERAEWADLLFELELATLSSRRRSY
ncbi:hypothetical protein [Skermania piniformis]|uniref:Uncharacterized protein n=1 Tax=Skermania pinensis TaxID=39122 RepID=A0ABX8SBG1_9ACTN|nr:hypothetical protein [Skermania piniformis]QXQ15198.1 hypothetical protein KV203_07655 [Skermania piniformis]